MRTAESRNLTEGELVELARRGATDALAAIYESYSPELFRLARRITGSSADAEEVVHDLFVGLPEMLRRYDHRGRVNARLRAIVVRTRNTPTERRRWITRTFDIDR